jgi:hypothetical protein
MRERCRFAWQLTRTRIPLSETDFELSVTTSYDGDEALTNHRSDKMGNAYVSARESRELHQEPRTEC